jgi:hypothetical protein
MSQSNTIIPESLTQWLPGPAAGSHPELLLIVALISTLLAGSFIIKAITESKRSFVVITFALLIPFLAAVFAVIIADTFLLGSVPEKFQPYLPYLAVLVGGLLVGAPILKMIIGGKFSNIIFGMLIAYGCIYGLTLAGSYLVDGIDVGSSAVETGIQRRSGENVVP